jgi:TolA-binding protein
MSSSDFTPLERDKKVRFDPTINLGHLLTFAGFIMAGFGAWATLDARLVRLEEGRRTQEMVDRAQDARYDQGIRQVQQQLEKMDRHIEHLVNRQNGTDR